MIGSKLGHYEIIELIGSGGMGEVYRARDTKLQRDVALKVLPAGMAQDPDRRMRFEREARAVAALKHPHIVVIHSVEESGDTLFLTMELVEGRTLTEVIPENGMMLDQFFAIALPLTDAIASAHQKGITHRDLKPVNVMIGHDKQLKVLDFGLAKLAELDAVQMKTIGPQEGTAEGRVLGTVAYMSPEQAEGKPVDSRSDIFSLGVMLYEMATGKRPFRGDSNISTIASILRDEPTSITDLKQSLPKQLGRIIRRCLAKDPDRRYHSAQDLRNDLLELKEEIASGEFEVPATAIAKPAPAKRTPFLMAFSLSLLVLILAFAIIKFVPRSKPALPSGQAMHMTRLTDTGKSIEAAISPDGKMVASVQLDKGQYSLWVTQVSTSSSVQTVPGSPAIWDPTFDPAGEFVYFVRTEKGEEIPALYRIPVLGGTPQKILKGVEQTISFSPDGNRFAYLRVDRATNKTQIVVVNKDGSGEQVVATKEPPDQFSENPAWSPDGKVIAAPVQAVRSTIESYVVLFPAAGGPEKRLSKRSWLNVSEMVWLPDGSGLVIAASETFADGQLWEVSYPSGLERRITNDVNLYSGVSLTADGRTLAVGIDDQNYTVQIVTPGEQGDPAVLGSGKNRNDGIGISWTPDGSLVYGSITESGAGICMIKADGTGFEKITQMTSVEPEASPDGRSLVYTAIQNGIHVWKSNLDGSNPVQLTKDQVAETQACWSPDGRWIVYRAGTENQLFKISAEGGDPTLLSPLTGVYGPIVSPDGTKIAFTAWDASAGKSRLFVIPFAGGDPTATFDLPNRDHRWYPDGKAITYTDTKDGVDNLWVKPLDGGPARQLTDFHEDTTGSFAWSRDGKRIAISRGQSSSDVVLITNFR